MAVDSPSAPNAGHKLPEAVIEELLADPHRRVVLHSLSEHDEPLTVRRLGALIVARERSIHPDTVPSEAQIRVRKQLYEHHIPKLTATGVIQYNPRHASVELGDAANQLLDRLQTNG